MNIGLVKLRMIEKMYNMKVYCYYMYFVKRNNIVSEWFSYIIHRNNPKSQQNTVFLILK